VILTKPKVQHFPPPQSTIWHLSILRTINSVCLAFNKILTNPIAAHKITLSRCLLFETDNNFHKDNLQFKLAKSTYDQIELESFNWAKYQIKSKSALICHKWIRWNKAWSFYWYIKKCHRLNTTFLQLTESIRQNVIK
jgi:hypothetical protein